MPSIPSSWRSEEVEETECLSEEVVLPCLLLEDGVLTEGESSFKKKSLKMAEEPNLFVLMVSLSIL